MAATHSEVPQNGNYQEAADAMDGVRKCILAVPYPRLMEAARKSHNSASVDVDFLRIQTSRLLDQLVFEAHIGNEDAIMALRDLGIQITTELAELVGDPNDKVSKTIDTPSSFPEDKADPAPNISGEQTDQYLEQLAQCPVGVLRGCLRGLAQYPAVDVPVLWKDVYSDTADEASIYDLSAVTENQAQTESVESQEPEVWDFSKLPVVPGNKHIYSPGVPQKKVYTQGGLVEAIFRRFVGLRIIHVARRVARRVLADSMRWPIDVSAIPDKRSKQMGEYVAGLGLGTSSPVVKAGGNRKFLRNSNTGATLRVFEKLEAERIQAKRYSPVFLESLKSKASAIKPAAKPGNLSTSPVAHSGLAPTDEGGLRSRPWPRWIMLAFNLPELSRDLDVINLWLDAGMDFLGEKCGGDFDKCIWPNVSTKPNKTGRSCETLIRNKLREGLHALVS